MPQPIINISPSPAASHSAVPPADGTRDSNFTDSLHRAVNDGEGSVPRPSGSNDKSTNSVDDSAHDTAGYEQPEKQTDAAQSETNAEEHSRESNVEQAEGSATDIDTLELSDETAIHALIVPQNAQETTAAIPAVPKVVKDDVKLASPEDSASGKEEPASVANLANQSESSDSQLDISSTSGDESLARETPIPLENFSEPLENPSKLTGNTETSVEVKNSDAEATAASTAASSRAVATSTVATTATATPQASNQKLKPNVASTVEAESSATEAFDTQSQSPTSDQARPRSQANVLPDAVTPPAPPTEMPVQEEASAAMEQVISGSRETHQESGSAEVRDPPPPAPSSFQSLVERTTSGSTQPTTDRLDTTTLEQSRVDVGRFVHRVSRALQAAEQREGPVQLRLSPPELGAMKIELNVQQGTLTAKLETETAAAKNVLLDNLPALRERLAALEIRVDKFDVDVQQQGAESSPDWQAQQDAHDTHRGQAGRLSTESKQASSNEAEVSSEPKSQSTHHDGQFSAVA